MLCSGEHLSLLIMQTHHRCAPFFTPGLSGHFQKAVHLFWSLTSDSTAHHFTLLTVSTTVYNCCGEFVETLCLFGEGQLLPPSLGPLFLSSSLTSANFDTEGEKKNDPPGRLLIKVTVGGQERSRLQVSNSADWKLRSMTRHFHCQVTLCVNVYITRSHKQVFLYQLSLYSIGKYEFD